MFSKCVKFVNYSLTHWGRDKMATISQATFWMAFSLFKFQLKFHWSLFPRIWLKVIQHFSDNGLAPNRQSESMMAYFTEAYTHHTASALEYYLYLFIMYKLNLVFFHLQRLGQAIIWTNDGIMLIVPLFSEILIKIHTFSFKQMHLKMLYGKWQPYCPSLNVLMLFYWCSDPETISERNGLTRTRPPCTTIDENGLIRI